MTFNEYLNARGAAHLIDRAVLERYVQSYIGERYAADITLRQVGDPFIGTHAAFGTDWVNVQVTYSRDVALSETARTRLTELVAEIKHTLAIALSQETAPQ